MLYFFSITFSITYLVNNNRGIVGRDHFRFSYYIIKVHP